MKKKTSINYYWELVGKYYLYLKSPNQKYCLSRRDKLNERIR